LFSLLYVNVSAAPSGIAKFTKFNQTTEADRQDPSAMKAFLWSLDILGQKDKATLITRNLCGFIY